MLTDTTAATPTAPALGRFLLVRYGGQGDALFLTPVAQELARRGWEVHVAINDQGYPLLMHLPFVRQLHPLSRDFPLKALADAPSHPADYINWRGGWVPVEGIYHEFPSPGPEYGTAAVVNYRFVIENNTIHPWLRHTQNSDRINTYDTHLSWAGIDPNELTPAQRRPVYRVNPQERAVLAPLIACLPRPVYLVQTFASSPARSYHRVRELVDAMQKRTRGTVIAWNRSEWECKGSPFPLACAPGSYPIRATAALIEQADLLVCADTAVCHIAQGLERPTRTVVFHSTVPSWCRVRDYINCVSIDATAPDSTGTARCACCVIAANCPRMLASAWGELTERERDLFRLLPPEEQRQRGIEPQPPRCAIDRVPPSEWFRTTPHGLDAEMHAAVARYDGLCGRLAPCVASIDLWPVVEREMGELEK